MAVRKGSRGNPFALRWILTVPLSMAAAGIFFVHHEMMISTPLLGGEVAEGDAPRTTTATGGGGVKEAKNNWRSSNSAVLAMATNMGMIEFYNFVGSLRATGFSGHIVLGISDGAGDDVVAYMKSQNVTVKYQGEKYGEYKVSHARFFLYRDWIEDCTGCTDGIMLTDFRDAYFQADPFATAVALGQQHPIMVFEELVDGEHSTTHWLTYDPVLACRGYTFGGHQPMLCSGSTMGSREGILEYLRAMTTEIQHWKATEKCRFDMVGDDQSIHNYLFYTDQLNYTTDDGRVLNAMAIPHRTGSIHVVGVQAARIHEKVHKTIGCKDWPEPCPERVNYYVRNDTWQNWLPERPGYGAPNDTTRLLDATTGMILNLDGRPSAQVHQVDRFGDLPQRWFKMMREMGWPYNRPTFQYFPIPFSLRSIERQTWQDN